MTLSKSSIFQAEHYSTLACHSLVSQIEGRYKYVDERNFFASLVNFSTAKGEPYQGWVRYREGYSTKLVSELIKRSHISPKSHFIADPMVGSGSTLISAIENGYCGFGVDVNPFCELIVRAKLLSPTQADIAAVNDVLQMISRLNVRRSHKRTELLNFFSEENRNWLLTLKGAIKDIPEGAAKTILTAAWFFCIEPCSNRKKDGNGLATRPSPVKDVREFFMSVVKRMLDDFNTSPLKHNQKSKVYVGSACEFSTYVADFTKISRKKLGAVIFSPPYANAFNYFESYKMELLFGELLSLKDYKRQRGKLIRNFRICYGRTLKSEYPVVEAICQEINNEIPRKEEKSGKKDTRTRLMPNMLRAYFEDMGKVLQQIFDASPTGCRCHIVVDQSAYVGVIVPTDIILAWIGEQIGFKVEQISICRNAATSAQQFKQFPYLKNSLRESIVTLVR